tara:strand:- start:2087 stop:2668 length:582 start_codon:yes stop_codon:yes gene_type:complete
MGEVYTDYFQKSKVFLYPLLKLQKGLNYVPSQTYCGWEDVYGPEDKMFLCEYHSKMTNSFEEFATQYLNNHPMFREHISLEEDRQLFVFDFTRFAFDWNKFLKGLYSQYSLPGKISILDYFDGSQNANEYIKGFLSPEDVHADYAKKLGVDLKTMKKVYEVCSAPDMEKEILVDNNYILYKLLKESSIYLSNK